MDCKHVGKKFGTYTILDLDRVDRTPSGSYVQFVKVRCDCGAEYVKRVQQVTASKGLGCKACKGEAYSEMSKTGYKHPMHTKWWSMISRCHDPRAEMYKYYGGRGIEVCDRWRQATAKARLGTMTGFRNFLADMGQPPDGYSLDRIDNDGPYSPENCRWATAEEQQNNTRANVRATVDGITLTVAQWARALGVPDGKLRAPCYNHGIPVEDVVRRVMDTPPHLRVKYMAWVERKVVARAAKSTEPFDWSEIDSMIDEIDDVC